MKKIIKKAIKKGFLEFPHQWSGLEVRPPCRKLKLKIDLDEQFLMDVDSQNIIWWKGTGWATVIKEELLNVEDLINEGIYVYKGTRHNFVFRLKSVSTNALNVYGSYDTTDKEYFTGGFFSFHGDGILKATDDEKKTLIKLEVDNDYFHELSK
jgi:hypothetical protein